MENNKKNNQLDQEKPDKRKGEEEVKAVVQDTIDPKEELLDTQVD